MNLRQPALLATLWVVSLFAQTARLVAGAAGPSSAPADRHAAALDAARIRQVSLADIAENSLLIGNGDLNGLIYAADGCLQLRLTKNDVWDARLDTSRDPDLAVIDPSAHTVKGGGTPASWDQPYPCPLACGILEFPSHGARVGWQSVRSEGTTNTWLWDGTHALMAIAGKPGASCGWQRRLPGGKPFSQLRLHVSGSANARHYVTVGGRGKPFESRWKDAPVAEREVVFDLPKGLEPTHVILYAWTTDGAPAYVRYTAIDLAGESGSRPLDLATVTPPPADYGLDLRRAVATVPGTSPTDQVQVRAQADRNVIVIEGHTTVTLRASTASFIPQAEAGSRDGVDYLAQRLPPDPGYPETGDWAGMSFAVAKMTRAGRTAVAIVTSQESPQPLADAIGLVQTTLAGDPATQRKAHEDAWTAFWSASGVDLADTYLRDVWYRSLYFMRCVSKPGVKPVGLYAGLVDDSPAWHGDFHLNYNAQQTYWGWYNCNHAELSGPYEWLIEQLLPRARWLARRTYGCNGAHFAHSVFLYEPPDPSACKSRNGRQMAFIPYTYTLGDTGWAVQNHWLHYQYYPDRSLLEKQVYPTVREAALFYAEFADKCRTNPATGRIIFGPTYSPEHWELGRDDGTCDIAFARLALKAAIQGAKALDTDPDLVARWERTLRRLPDYPRTDGPDPVVVDVAGAPPTCYNVPVPALPVYPAGEVTWFSPDAEKALFSRTIAGMSSNGNNDLIILAGARARLSLPDAYAWTRQQFLCRQRPNGTLSIAPRGGGFNGFGHFTEDFAAGSVITEMLVQSVGGVIRVFPAWPKDKDAEFANLRAEGGFLVAAERRDGRVRNLEIASTVGGRLRLLDPWTGAVVEKETQPGQRLHFTPQESP